VNINRKTQVSIGIIGAGALGSNVARLLARSGIAATIANRRGPSSLASLVKDLNPFIKAGPTDEAAKADIVILAVRWADLQTALDGLPYWSGRIVIDATNPVAFLASDSSDRTDPNNPLAAYGLKTIDLGGKVSTRVVGGFVPGARVVKAFNHLPVNLLPEPAACGGKRVLFYSGDDAGAKAKVRKVLERTGAFPVDLGTLDVGAPLVSMPFGPFAGISLIKE
jgi:hypothetical protein